MDLIASKILALILLGVLSLISGLLPLKFFRGKRKGNKGRGLIVSCLLCGGAGVLLATVFIHMIPETRENFATARKLGLLGGPAPNHNHDDHDGHDHHDHHDHHAHAEHLRQQEGIIQSINLGKNVDKSHKATGDKNHDHDHDHETHTHDDHDHHAHAPEDHIQPTITPDDHTDHIHSSNDHDHHTHTHDDHDHHTHGPDDHDHHTHAPDDHDHHTHAPDDHDHYTHNPDDHNDHKNEKDTTTEHPKAEGKNHTGHHEDASERSHDPSFEVPLGKTGENHEHNHEEHDHEHGSYPLAELVTCAGFFLIYFIEEFVHKVGNSYFIFLLCYR